jgi:hypothetical protein
MRALGETLFRWRVVGHHVFRLRILALRSWQVIIDPPKARAKAKQAATSMKIGL